MTHDLVQMLRNAIQEEKVDQALQSQASTKLQGQSNHLEVMYHCGKVNNFSTWKSSPTDLHTAFHNRWPSAGGRKGGSLRSRRSLYNDT